MHSYSLAGEWKLFLDGGKEYTSPVIPYNDTINLPSTTAIARKGIENTNRETGFLTELYPFEGYAWYSHTAKINDDDLNGRLFITLERTRLTKLWIDGKFVGERDSLTTEHIYEITDYVNQNEFEITVQVSNTDYPTKGGHLTSPDTQTNWNGILGALSLKATGTAVITSVYADSDIESRKISLRLEIDSTEDTSCQLSVSLSELNPEGISGEKISCVEFSTDVQSGVHSYSFTFDADNAKLWNEYEPNVYNIGIELYTADTLSYSENTVFGLRDFKTDGMSFSVNGTKTMLRGKHDGMIFPLTGAAPCTVDGWLSVMKTAKDYGINHYRFHTCCPPDAAFTAADLLGIYMEPELPFWGTIAAKCDDGYNESEQEYLIKEGFRMMRSFGNHPSFCMLSLGNELWGSPERLSEILRGYREVDTRHLYTQGSNNFQHVPVILPEEDFWCGVRLNKTRLIRGSYGQCDAPLGHVQTAKPSTRHNYDSIIMSTSASGAAIDDGAEIEIQYGTGVKKVKAVNADDGLTPNIPIVTHEIGQYAVWPNMAEIEKYTGVLRARNFEVFGERLREKGLYDKAEDFFKASGKLSALCYKEELETVHRSEKIAGYQILDLQDFSGQGTATVGMLDAFMDSKGLITPSQWRGFCSDCVLLAQFDSYVLTYGSVFKADLAISYFNSSHSIKSQKLYWQLGNYAHGEIEIPDNSYGLVQLDSISVSLPDKVTAEKVRLSLSLENPKTENSYDLFIYPNCGFENTKQVNIVHSADDAIGLLEKGESVLLIPDEVKQGVKGFYCSDFWCYSMFKAISEWMGREIPVGTLGLLIDDTHPVFKNFPTSYHSEPQWWSLVESCDTTILDDTDISPIVYTIDNFERCHKLGMMFECRVGNGKLFVLNAKAHKLADCPEAALLLKCICEYISSDEFAPKAELSAEKLSELYR